MLKYIDDALRQDLRRFLWEAASATWLVGRGQTSNLNFNVPQAKEYKYVNLGFVYHDCYVGYRRFVGQEVILRFGDCLWMRNYAGGIDPERELSDEKVEEIYSFLKRARKECWSKLYGSSPDGREQVHTYEDEESGKLYGYMCKAHSPYKQPLIDFSIGMEHILCEGYQDYYLQFSGGIILDKPSSE